eukprot:5173788-Alexandrium_andersonii.AAC.1
MLLSMVLPDAPLETRARGCADSAEGGVPGDSTQQSLEVKVEHQVPIAAPAAPPLPPHHASPPLVVVGYGAPDSGVRDGAVDAAD